MIHARQPEYYVAINTSNDAGESTVFIEFMLSAIKASLVDAISTSDGPSDESVDKATMRWKQIEELLSIIWLDIYRKPLHKTMHLPENKKAIIDNNAFCLWNLFLISISAFI